MRIKFRKIWLAVAGTAALALAGCGGGGGTPVATTTTPSTTTPISTTVIDGAVKNAVVCLDKNKNGACDADEPQGKTDVAGKVTFNVADADVGKYPILAVVGTDAVDADTGPVATAYTMTAPADKPTVVSPLTTMVQQMIAITGASSTDAAAAVQNALGLSVSVFQDYTKVAAPTDGTQNPATVARMIVVTTQQQATTISSATGTTAADGTVITKAALDQAIQKKLLELLPALLTALSDPAVQAATTPAAKEAALLAAARTLITNSGLTVAAMPTVVAINNQTSSTTPVAATPPSAGFSLANLNFTDSLNFGARVLGASLAQATPDANNKTRYVERRIRSNAGSVAQWGSGRDPARGADLSWSGTAWTNCPINFENTSTVRDAQGNSAYNYCDNRETGKSNRATFDIGGKTMANVITNVRAAGYTNLSIGDSTPATLATLLGSTTFPTGASLLYQTSTPLTQAISYYPGSGNVVTQYSAAVSAGGIASTQGSGVGCNSAEFNTSGSNSTTLEGMISAMTGTPCIFGQGSFKYPAITGPTYTSPDASDEAWGNSTVGLGTIGTAPVGTGATAPGFYSGNTKLRVAFKGTGSNPVTYYACKERFNTGSTRNCAAIGTGTYTITTLGDARALTLNNLPAQTGPLNFTRVFVERGGRVYFGYQDKLGVFNSARLNTVAANALLTRLGMPTVDPSVPLALTPGSYQGVWDVRDPANATAPGITFSINGNGSVFCQNTVTFAPITPCSLSFTNAATGAVTAAGGTALNATGTLNFLTGSGSGTFTDPSSTPTSGNFVANRR